MRFNFFLIRQTHTDGTCNIIYPKSYKYSEIVAQFDGYCETHGDGYTFEIHAMDADTMAPAALLLAQGGIKDSLARMEAKRKAA